ncbi:MAG TPA: hypothetical protein VF225_00005, partial [Gaiellaceae bacterium]
PGSKGGNVVPTQSPGPVVNNPSDPDNPTRGRSVGQFKQDGSTSRLFAALPSATEPSRSCGRARSPAAGASTSPFESFLGKL